MSEGNKFVVRRSFEELWNKGNLSLADELFTPNYEHHDASSPDFGRGPESEKKRAALYRTAFPDLQLTIEDIIAEGQTVMARRSEEHTSELQSPDHLVCRLLLEKKKPQNLRSGVRR